MRAVLRESCAPLSDMKELVRRAQGGDHRAFEALYRETVGHVYAVCLRLSADPGEAEELTQSAFVCL